MILAIDIGNTDTVLGIYKGKKLLSEYRFPSKPVLNQKEYYDNLNLFCKNANVSVHDLRGVTIASVVPRIVGPMMIMAKKRLKLNPVIVSGGLDLGIRIHYDDRKSLGADRLCNAVAAFEKYGGPAIVIDLGTATTYDVISREGDYLGGVITPGVGTAASALHHKTAQLPNIKLRFPKNIIGTNTTSSMQAGILFGAIDSMEGIVRRIKHVIGKNAVVIGTGGYATMMAGQSKIIDYLEPSLVLEGARLIYERVSSKRK